MLLRVAKRKGFVNSARMAAVSILIVGAGALIVHSVLSISTSNEYSCVVIDDKIRQLDDCSPGLQKQLTFLIRNCSGRPARVIGFAEC
jgi:hypothetical protein